MASKLLRFGSTLSKGITQVRSSGGISSGYSGGGAVSQAYLHELSEESEKHPEKLDQHFINYFSRPEIDSWELRKGLTELHLMDVIPDPKVAEAALRACRRLNDFSLCIRFLESIKFKTLSVHPLSHVFTKESDKIYNYIMTELKPVLDELGIPTIEEVGYNKPEFFTPDAGAHWEHKWFKEYGYDKFYAWKDASFAKK